jgi:hypothetical protein
MHLMVEAMDTEQKRDDLIHALTGPFRTMGTTFNVEDIGAPDWWHGDEDAYASTMANINTVAQRGR